jgi:DNA-binding beta-propeller fold protein YncE
MKIKTIMHWKIKMGKLTNSLNLSPSFFGLLLTFCFLFSLTGCSTKWVMESPPVQGSLIWPEPPESPKIRQISIITGFKEEGRSLKSILAGQDEGRLSKPVAVTAGADGRFAVADTGCSCVHLYIPDQKKYVKLSGTKLEQMRSPVGVAFDRDLSLYISDSALGRVFVFDKNGEYLSSLESAGSLPLSRPTGLAYNSRAGLMYIADTLSHKIHVFDTQTKRFFSFGERGSTEGGFNFPTHVFSSVSGDLYVTDAMNFRIQAFNADGKFLAAFGRHGDGSGDFAMPKGVAIDSNDTVYVVDSLFDNVQLFSRTGDFLLTVGSRGTEAGEFWLPSGIFVDRNDKLYVCDTFNQRIQVFQILKHE